MVEHCLQQYYDKSNETILENFIDSQTIMIKIIQNLIG